MNQQTKAKAYYEVDKILVMLGDKYEKKIQKDLRKTFKEEKAQNYIKQLNINIPFEQQNLLQETKDIIAYLNLNYWCKEEEKIKLNEIYSKRAIEKESKLKQKWISIANLYTH
jgi:hypothetical protein